MIKGLEHLLVNPGVLGGMETASIVSFKLQCRSNMLLLDGDPNMPQAAPLTSVDLEEAQKNEMGTTHPSSAGAAA